MAALKALLRDPIFLGGLALKLVLIAAVIPLAVSDWYAPFLEHSLRSPSLDPWGSFLAAGGIQRAFPYGYAMWAALAPLTALSLLAGAPVRLGYGLTLLAADIAMLVVLGAITQAPRRKLLLLYWLSPITLFATYWLGLNDIVPILFLIISLWMLKDRRPIVAGASAAFAVAAKLSMGLGLPLLLIYLFNNRRLRRFLVPFVLGAAGGLTILCVPWLLSSGARSMLFLNPEMEKPYELAVNFGQGMQVYILPLVYLLTLFAAWRVRRMSFELLLNLLGTIFFLVLILTPAAPGWFVWVLPFLVLHQLKDGATAVALVTGFGLLYIGLNTCLSPLPAIGLAGWPSGVKLVDTLGLSVKAWSLWQTLLLGGGLIIASRMVREGIQSNEYFRLSRTPFLIGIAGDSGAGKDTLATAVAGVIGAHSVTHISGDDYHLWDRHKPMWQVMTHLNPRANALAQLVYDVQALASGRSVAVRRYDHTNGRSRGGHRVESTPFIIVSGLHTLYPLPLRETLGLKIYLNMDDGLRRQFKVRRDVEGRGHTREDVELALAKREPDAVMFIRPQAQFADLIFSLQPIRALADAEPRLKLLVDARHGVSYDRLVRVLIGVCGLHVDMAERGADGSATLSIEGDTTPEDIALAARTLLPDFEEMIDLDPAWSHGTLGLMQLIVLMHTEQSLRKRLL
jgi:uridine kinase